MIRIKAIRNMKHFRELISTSGDMKTKCICFGSDHITVEDVFATVEFFKEHDCKMKKKDFAYFYGKMLNDYIYQNNSDHRKLSTIRENDMYLCFNIKNIKNYTSICEDMAHAGMRWLDDIIANCPK